MRLRISPASGCCVVSAAALLLADFGRGEGRTPALSPLFGAGMVMQRDRPNPLRGSADPGTRVEIRIGDRRTEAIASADGTWCAWIDPPAPGGPYQLSVGGPDGIVLDDVLVGDLWLCAGQSNMEMGLTRALDGVAEAARAENPSIRLFRVDASPAYKPAAEVSGAWRKCEPRSFLEGGGFSAVAYYFGRRIQRETGVPVGLIQCAVGGSPAESWMSPAALAGFPDFAPELAEMTQLAAGSKVYGNFVMHWYERHDRGVAESWERPDFDDSAWQTTSLRGGFAGLGLEEHPAVVWFRRTVTLPDPLPPGPVRIVLGVVERMDTVYVNGRWSGASAWVENPRDYRIPDGVPRSGENHIAIRVFKVARDGGFRTPAEGLKIVLGDGREIPLEGGWRAAAGVDASPPHPLPLRYENYPTMPATLHLGMIRPLAPLPLKGVIWYQGEANTGNAEQYRALLPALIADWRAVFHREDLPFYIAGLPAFMQRRDRPGGDGWAALREAQAIAARTVPYAAMAVTIDTGDADDIHPREKQAVGERLALLALHHSYGVEVAHEGPVFTRSSREGSAMRLHFRCADGGLVARGGPPGEFSIAGEDRAWHWAEARIDGNSVVVSSPAVPEPVAVRYAWQANPAATLTDATGLPAAPFRTDDWPEAASR